MEHPNFVIGFIIAGVIGFCSNLIVMSWQNIGNTNHQMFNDPPQPALRPLPNSINSTIGAEPTESPIQVVAGGCLNIIGQLILQLIFLAVIYLIIYITLSEFEIDQDFLIGTLFAAVFAILLSQFVHNWAMISNLFQQITNPPQPALNPINPPNDQHTAANPPEPAFTVLVNNIAEIFIRVIWGIALGYIIILTVRAAYFYMETGAVFQTTGGFGT